MHESTGNQDINSKLFLGTRYHCMKPHICIKFDDTMQCPENISIKVGTGKVNAHTEI